MTETPSSAGIVDQVRARAEHAAKRAALELEASLVLRKAGMLDPKVVRALAAASRAWKGVLAAGFAAWADLTPDRTALVDEAGFLTYREVHQRTNAVAHGLTEEGTAPNSAVAVLCRNHRGFVDASVAASKLGCDVLLLNTGFAGPQLRDVLDREGADTVLFDEEFTDMVRDHAGDQRTLVLTEDTVGGTLPSVGDLLRRHTRVAPEPPDRTGKLVILTSGTTGTPKGANRPNPRPLPSTGAMMFSRIPYRTQMTFVVAAPMFHAWGLGQMLVSQNSGGTIVLRRRFDPEQTLRDIAMYRAEALGVVPVMLQRILALDPDVSERYDLSSLEIVASSGAALPGHLATEWMDRFGDNLYNFYGSTEVGQATIATPDDMRAAPGTAGKPPLGTDVRLLDDQGNEVPHGEVGRIFVANSMQFDGYTGGGDKERIAGRMSSGDVGWFDDDGRLFVSGRDDDMIVSGGENVFPREVEDLLADHAAVAEAAVVGVPDTEFGQRLRAFVVLATGAAADEAELKSYVKANLAAYKTPRSVTFLDELPRNPTGKILKRELKELPEAG